MLPKMGVGGWPINIYNGAGFRFQAVTGYQAAWLEGRSYWSLVHPADVQGLRGAVARRKRKYIFIKPIENISL